MGMQALQFRSSFILAVIMIGLMSYLNSYYAGVVIAKLPFVPFSFIQGLSHRNLEGDDMTDCSMIFLYVIAGMGVRANLKRCSGTNRPRPLKCRSLTSLTIPIAPLNNKFNEAYVALFFIHFNIYLVICFLLIKSKVQKEIS